MQLADLHISGLVNRQLPARYKHTAQYDLFTGVFGMNFEFLPPIHCESWWWWAIATMAVVGLAFVMVFWRKRYLARTAR